MNKILLGLVSLLLISCASTHPGVKGSRITSNSDFDLSVSANLVEEYSDEAHQFIDFTFENTKSSWERIESISFEYGNENIPYNIIVGNDLKTWAKSLADRQAIENYNKLITLTGLAMTGAVLAGVSDDKNLQAAGAFSYAAGVSGLVFEGFKEGQKELNISKTVPDGHLFAGSFSVPAKMFVRKWILLNVPGDKWSTVVFLTVKTLDGRTEKYEIPLR